jgi:hypothetical protein
MDLAFDKGLEFDEILGKDKQVKFNWSILLNSNISDT